MRHLLNTLYVTTPENYLSLDGENVVVSREKAEVARFPLQTFESIICFTYPGASPALMGACASRGIDISFFSPHGKFLARAVGEERGNVLLRMAQYKIADSEQQSCLYARNFILGKVYNSKWVLERTLRDHPQRVPHDVIKEVSTQLTQVLPAIRKCDELELLRGIEGKAAQQYFSVFDHLILQQHESFQFSGRSRRPPLDNLNALLSFTYTMLAHDCAAALQSVGLDPYVGFMHRPRPGRNSLALDMMEELRPVMADRMVLTCINQRMISSENFDHYESGAVLLNDNGRRRFLKAWQEKKKEQLAHPFLNEKIEWGLVPYVQALLLSRTLRGDLDVYPPFLWK